MLTNRTRRRAVLATTAAALTALPLAAHATAADWPSPTPDASRPAVKIQPKKSSYGVSEKVLKSIKAYNPVTSDFRATWKRADALKVALDPTNTTPRIPENFPIISDQVWQWDTWPLTGLDTKPLKYKGWQVIFSLVAPRSIPYGDRHWQARIGYFISKDGRSWKYQGHLFPEGYSKGSREWAGTAILTGTNTVTQFYTASGKDNGGINNTDSLQRLAVASGKIHADSKGVWFTGFRNHKIIAEADGDMYQTLEQSESGPIIYAFRDPFVFQDPKDKQVYAVFEGNTGGVAGTHECTKKDLGNLPPGHTVPPDSIYYTGNIGLMKASDTAMRSWKLLPPIFSANCVNQQVERPHLVFKNGRYFLFTISHMFTYAPGLTGPDGLYGFVGTGLRSDYKPLNGSALVLGNPADAPEQNYSHEVLPNFMVQSFIDQVPAAAGTKIGGMTLAPTLQLAVTGSNTYLTRVLPYGYIPAMASVG